MLIIYHRQTEERAALGHNQFTSQDYYRRRDDDDDDDFVSQIAQIMSHSSAIHDAYYRMHTN